MRDVWDPRSVPIREDAAQRPINPYGRSKLMVEQILEDFDRAHGLVAIALRYFNAAGADPEGELGEVHDPQTHLIPLAIGAAMGSAPPLTVYGDDYATADGTCVRDYIHVTDLAAAHVLALRKLLDGGGSDRINLGTGTGASVREVLAAVERAGGRAVPRSSLGLAGDGTGGVNRTSVPVAPFSSRRFEGLAGLKEGSRAFGDAAASAMSEQA